MTETVLTRAALGEGRSLSTARAVTLAVAGSMLIAICARIQVPMWPVPVTMQTFAVLLIGLAYGARMGLATVALYLAEGAMGLPVFASGGGIAYLAGPTAGYLLSYLPAVATVGWLAQQGWGRPAARIFLAMLLGSAIIYLFGATWLAGFVGMEKAVALGVVPFLIGDVVKAALAAALLPLAWRMLVKL